MLRLLLAFLAGALLTGAISLVQEWTQTVPASEFVSPEAISAAASIREDMAPHALSLVTGDIETQRSILDEYFYGPKIEEARKLYPTQESVLEIDGVYTEVFEPAAGVQKANANRVLINLHGGAFSLRRHPSAQP